MPARRLIATAVVAVALALGAGACGGGSGAASTPDGGRVAAATEGAASPLSFSSPAIGGGTVEGAAFQGRPALLWFWAPW